ncbi:MAG TPA: IS1 family transposase [bacterium]
MNRLSRKRQTEVIAALVEGNSVRATCRMTGVAKGTILSLLADLGPLCDAYQDTHSRNLYCRRIQCDEVWAFCHAKAKNVPEEKRGQFGYGDVWTWVALDADSKLVVCWHLGLRTPEDAIALMTDLASRLKHRIQLTTDGHFAYLDGVEEGFGADIDYAMLVKLYGRTSESDTRYSPATCVGTHLEVVVGSPDKKHISTSYVERQNLTMRMGMRRLTRLTNAFSKKVENLQHALALHFMHYNFARVHKTLGMTPAMAAGVSDHPWSVGEIVALLPN